LFGNLELYALHDSLLGKLKTAIRVRLI